MMYLKMKRMNLKNDGEHEEYFLFQWEFNKNEFADLNPSTPLMGTSTIRGSLKGQYCKLLKR
jgi:hypothetical protein